MFSARLTFAYACRRTDPFFRMDMPGSLLRFAGFRRGFLCEVPLQILELQFNGGDLVGLVISRERRLPRSEGTFKQLSGAFILAKLQIDVGEVAQDRRIVAFAIDGLPQIFLSLDQLVLFVVRPAQAVEGGAFVVCPRPCAPG